MSYQKRRRKIDRLSGILVLALTSFYLGCGVKGDPLPPVKPAELGRGRPTYKKATEDIQIEHVPGTDLRSKKSKNHDDDEDENDG